MARNTATASAILPEGTNRQAAPWNDEHTRYFTLLLFRLHLASRRSTPFFSPAVAAAAAAAAAPGTPEPQVLLARKEPFVPPVEQGPELPIAAAAAAAGPERRHPNPPTARRARRPGTSVAWRTTRNRCPASTAPSRGTGRPRTAGPPPPPAPSWCRLRKASCCCCRRCCHRIASSTTTTTTRRCPCLSVTGLRGPRPRRCPGWTCIRETVVGEGQRQGANGFTCRFAVD